jgi:hypothetical protein
MKLWFAFLLFVLPISADSWKWSLVTVAAVNVADTASSLRCQSSPGVQEQNPLYGQFNGRAVGIKAGLVGGQTAVQWLIVRKWPKSRRFLTVLNFGQSAAPAWAAVHNMEVCK